MERALRRGTAYGRADTRCRPGRQEPRHSRQGADDEGGPRTRNSGRVRNGVAAPYTSARTICVTGSNGKTTTTLTYEILRRAGATALGSQHRPEFRAVGRHGRRDWYVIELSSFQLDGCYDFRAGNIGVLTNITPDHLDRYEYRLQNYVDSKFRILRNQRPQDCFIYCADDPLTLENLPKHPLSMRTLPFSVRRGDCAAVLRDGTIRAGARPPAGNSGFRASDQRDA